MLGGDPMSREVLILAMLGIVHSIVRRMRPRQTADFEDAIQEGLLWVCVEVGKYRPSPHADDLGANFAWTMRVNAGKSLFRYCRKDWRHHDTFPALSNLAPDTGFIEAFARDGQCSHFDVLHRFNQMIGGLPKGLPAVIRMRYGLAGEAPMALAHVAARLGVHKKTVLRYERHALELLRSELTAAFPSLAEGAGGIHEGTTAKDRRAEVFVHAAPASPVVLKMTPEVALEIVRLRETGMEARTIARRVGCDRRLVWSVISGNTLSRVTGIKLGTPVALPGSKKGHRAKLAGGLRRVLV
jgi:RNA polymerase sigma factor (sigma-70 family)